MRLTDEKGHDDDDDDYDDDDGDSDDMGESRCLFKVADFNVAM